MFPSTVNAFVLDVGEAIVHHSLCLSSRWIVSFVFLRTLRWKVALLSALDTKWWHGTVVLGMSWLFTSPADDIWFICCYVLRMFDALSIFALGSCVGR